MNNFTRYLIHFYLGLSLLYMTSCDFEQLTPGTPARLLRHIERSNVILTDEIVNKYLHTYSILKQKDPQLLKLVNRRDSLNKSQCAYLRVVETLVQKGGFKDFPDFVGTHAKITCVLYLVQQEARPATALGSIPSIVPSADETENMLTANEFPVEQVMKLTSPSEMMVIKKHIRHLSKVETE